MSRVIEWVVIAVRERLPGSSRPGLRGCRVQSQQVEGLRRRELARTGGQRDSPILCLPFVNPQKAVAHRCIQVPRPQVRGFPVKAVPRMHVLMRDKVFHIQMALLFRKVIRRQVHLARLQVFKTAIVRQNVTQ